MPIKQYLVALVSAFMLCSQVLAVTSAPNDFYKSLPNIVIFLADDMGYGDIGVNGNTIIKTPHIDGLAERGLNFSQFYASANVCTPSRAGLMTGRYAIRSGLAEGVLSANSEQGLPNAEETIAELAQRAGLQTGLIGKWHLGGFPTHHPHRHGWQTFFGVPHSNDMANFALFDGQREVERPVQQSSLTQRYTERAVRFINDNADQPFLLMVSHTMPHIPLYASDPFRGRSDAGLYGDVIEELDASVGSIVQALKARGLLSNTLIVFTSDNGPFFEGSVAGLKGGKGNGWEGGFRVPGVISWPDKISKARRIDSMASNLDLLPTLANILNVEPIAKVIDGKSLLPVFSGAKHGAHKYLYYFNNEGLIGLRDKRWKYLTHVYYRKSLGAFEKFHKLDGFDAGYDMLFAMNGGGHEQYSLADRKPVTLKRFKKELAKAREKFEALMIQKPDATFPE